MNSYMCSDGTRVDKSTVDYRVREAKKKKIEQTVRDQGYISCQICGRNESGGEPIDCSHEYSVDYCQKEGITELAWYIPNIIFRCRPCHKEHDNSGLAWTK